MRTYLFVFVIAALLSACDKKTQNTNQAIKTDAEYEFVLASEVDWSYLNPARKDKAPMAGTLYGDRSGNEPTGYLLKPKDGFQSPPHIHNVSYRGLVISGYLHNDDPNAANMWMPSGSFWTQPKGEVHITSAKGDDALAYIEIDEGPYLVWPAEEQFDSGERPINVEPSNIVWVNANEIKWIDSNSEGLQVAFLWGNRKSGQMNGTLIKFPAAYKGELTTQGDVLRAVVVNGVLTHQISGAKETKTLPQGSYFGAKGTSSQIIGTTTETLLYIRTNDQFHIK